MMMSLYIYPLHCTLPKLKELQKPTHTYLLTYLLRYIYMKHKANCALISVKVIRVEKVGESRPTKVKWPRKCSCSIDSSASGRTCREEKKMPTYLRTIRDRESVAFLVLETFNDSIISLSCTILVIHMYNNPCRMKEPPQNASWSNLCSSSSNHLCNGHSCKQW